LVVSDKFAELRQLAEAILKKKTSISDLNNQDIDFFELLHELDTYRIELELKSHKKCFRKKSHPTLDITN
jgi:hypothetical protein